MAAQCFGPSAEAQALSAMPVDVLRLILKDISLKERLRLEILNKSHRDALRDSELWHAIDLEALEALNCTEDQLLSLLSRIEPRMKRGGVQIRRMAESLDEITKSFTKHMMPKLAVEQLQRKTRGTLLREVVFFQLFCLQVLYKAVPESWGPVRFILETCTLWLVDQLQRIPLAVRFVCKVLRNLSSNPAAFLKNGTSSHLQKPDRQRSAKRAVLLNVSGAANLSPDFVAACAIAFSAAGFQLNVRIDGEGDPGFLTNHPVFDVIRSLALDCAFLVNLTVSGAYPWKANCLTPFNPWGRAQEPIGELETIKPKLERTAASIAPHFKGSRAAHQRFLGKISSLVELRKKIAAIAGGAVLQTRGATATIFSHTVILEHLVTPLEEPLLKELASFLRDAPSALRVVVRNCTLSCAEFRALSAALGEGGAGTVTFQHTGHVFSRNPHMARIVLGSAELQASQGLSSLALDFPLAPADLKSVALFLDRNAAADVVIHLRPAFYAQSAAAARQLFKKLKKLCSSPRGRRLTIVRHQGAAPIPNGTECTGRAERGGTAVTLRRGPLEDAFLAPLQQEIQSSLWFESALEAADRVVWGIFLVGVISGLLLLLDYLLFRVRFFGFFSELGFQIIVHVPFIVFPAWPPLRSAIQGEREPIDAVIFVMCVAPVLFSILPPDAVLRALYVYLCACLAWTILEWTGKCAVGWSRRMGPKIKEKVKGWSVPSITSSAKKWV